MSDHPHAVTLEIHIPQLAELADRMQSLEAVAGDTKAVIDQLSTDVAEIKTQQEKIMATLDQVLQDVSDESTAIDSIAAFIAGLKQQLADALAGTTIPPAVQAKIDAVFAGVETNKAKVAAALAANVTPSPAPPAG